MIDDRGFLKVPHEVSIIGTGTRSGSVGEGMFVRRYLGPLTLSVPPKCALQAKRIRPKCMWNFPDSFQDTAENRGMPAGPVVEASPTSSEHHRILHCAHETQDMTVLSCHVLLQARRYMMHTASMVSAGMLVA